ncbi:MAG TPA: aminotransferase class V-fold PLP-dependent enzyme [Saprospiraceae bacterium]|nr:aminotransferase class V-fold PLP-dependent enzyme [Saprospiraceae bacterium]
MQKNSNLEALFDKYREGIVGRNSKFTSPYGEKSIVYADWIASGRMYEPIEKIFQEIINPLVANTHTETNHTGTSMTNAYKKARHIIKNHVNADAEDILICAASGMTGVVNKFQRILGLKIHEKYTNNVRLSEEDRPIVFITHMEHHSNQTSWNETLGDVAIIPPNEQGLVDLEAFKKQLLKYSHRKIKIAAITSCSNVTGIKTPYYEIAQIMHQNDGVCFVDFACSAPYIEIDMHPKDFPNGDLDAIYFSPHKFLGGPGSPGILVFNRKLYTNRIPDDPGGGTVDYTNPWGESVYHESIEDREDGGTPAFLQTIRTALCIKLKEEMGVKNILEREKELNTYVFSRFKAIENIHLFAEHIDDRLGVFSFFIENAHFNLVVKLLNDIHGVQVRGGCSCAGTYGHYLFEISMNTSHEIRQKIVNGDLSQKPGWIRLSVHPTMSNEEIKFIMDAIEDVANNFSEYAIDYDYDVRKNEFFHKNEKSIDKEIDSWFDF